MTPSTDEPGPDARGVGDAGDAGFTLAETLIAMTIVVLLSGFALAAYGVATRAVARWERRTSLDDTAHVVRQRLALDLAAASRVAIPAPDSLLIWSDAYAPEASPVVFHVADGVLHRNGVQAHREAVRLERFEALAVSASGDTLRRVDTHGDSHPVTSRDAVALVVARATFALGTLRAKAEARVALPRTPSWPDR